jgi:hypothetical protein
MDEMDDGRWTMDDGLMDEMDRMDGMDLMDTGIYK